MAANSGMWCLGDLKDVGALTDDPRALAKAAAKHADAAIRKPEQHDPHRIDLRMAAELAALALDSAVEVAAGETVTSDRARKAALARIAKAIDKGLSRRVEAVRRILHTQCYHGDEFRGTDRQVVFGAVVRAEGLVDLILLAKGRV